MVVTYPSAADQSLFQHEDNIVAYVRESSELAYKYRSNRHVSEKHKESEPGRFIRAATNSNSSGRMRKNNFSGTFYFDYLVKEPNGDLHLHIQRRFENGTVVGLYAVGEDRKRHMTVRYIADANGYRAEISKDGEDDIQVSTTPDVANSASEKHLTHDGKFKLSRLTYPLQRGL
ncbi:hypothetical protein HNY73_020294 [Argiope bruennichi]|uniref:Uncharacterized protein n=1 Tax=Argiope bruennichi TaxID=94029 RepID=A0A8T0E742_ARGBR|nr:hypothetical protein HNY73_020294 [Argiope bruennichi]